MHINIDNYREIRVLSIRDNKGQYCMYIPKCENTF